MLKAIEIKPDVFWVGGIDWNERNFHGYTTERGSTYNAYLILDEKITLIDTCKKPFTGELIDRIADIVDPASIDYIVSNHVEMDHSGGLPALAEIAPKATIVTGAPKGVQGLRAHYGDGLNLVGVKTGDTLNIGRRTLAFVQTPMVHWPEVIMTYDTADKVLFSADGFGKFGALDVDEPWADEARRYYIGIVGKYGAQVQSVLKKAATLDIATICPLHGPVLTENLGYYLGLYNTWSSYAVEEEGIVIAYTSVYGNTEKAAELLAERLKDLGCPKVAMNNLALGDPAEAVEDAFRYGKLVLASPTYNGDVFPFMKHFIDALCERNYQNRTIGLIENGSWAPIAAKKMHAAFEKSRNITFTDTTVTVTSALNDDSREKIDALAKEIL